jgi:hypothetical protein
MVPNGVLVDSAVLKNRTQYFLDYVLDHQDASGWLGPEVFDTTKPRFLWGRYAASSSPTVAMSKYLPYPQLSVLLWCYTDG